MKVSIKFDVEVDDRVRHLVALYYGLPSPADIHMVRVFFQSHGSSGHELLADEEESENATRRR